MRVYGSNDRSKWELTVVVSLPSCSVHVLAVEGDNRLHPVDALHVVDEEVLLLWLRALSIYGSVRLLVGASPNIMFCGSFGSVRLLFGAPPRAQMQPDIHSWRSLIAALVFPF